MITDDVAEVDDPPLLVDNEQGRTSSDGEGASRLPSSCWAYSYQSGWSLWSDILGKPRWCSRSARLTVPSGRFRRVRSRACQAGFVAFACCWLAGCDSFPNAGPIRYRESDRAATELAEKPKLRATVQSKLVELFGPDVQHMKVPANSGLRDGGIYLADQMRLGDKVEPVLAKNPETGKETPIAGGYALYRNHCLHCHGVFGAGDGPTSAFLFPKPRDYRPGIFKFTSTNPSNAKPSRADLRKTLLYGLHGTSMPGFEATMTVPEIDQVIDYLTFLSIRGETEGYLIQMAGEAEDNAPDALEPDLIEEILAKVTESWTDAETQVVSPGTRRVASTPESIRRGRDLYLGINIQGPKLECVSCHGPAAEGNGSAFIDRTIFDDVVFRQYSFDEAAARSFRTQAEAEALSDHLKTSQPKSDLAGVTDFLTANPAILKVMRDDHLLFGESVTNPQFDYLVKNDMPKVTAAARKLLPDLDNPAFRTYLLAKYNLWMQGSHDVWNNPLRPANLTGGVYKGGRRPLDLYWRLAKGINGAKMPAHSNILSDDQIWDVVNFVLALPDDPGLLKTAQAEKKTAAVSQPDQQTTH